MTCDLIAVWMWITRTGGGESIKPDKRIATTDRTRCRRTTEPLAIPIRLARRVRVARRYAKSERRERGGAALSLSTWHTMFPYQRFRFG